MERFGNRHLKGYGKILERHVPRGHIAKKKLWDFMRSIVLGSAQNIADGTIRKFRQETDDPIEIVQLTELMYEMEANEYMESVAENLHNKLN